MADHKADETSTTDPTLTMERVKSVAAIIAALYFVLNTIFVGFGVNPLPFATEDVSAAVSSVGAVVMTVVVWWRQNVITKAADAGHRLTTAIKTGQVASVQGTSLPPEDTGAAGESDAAGDVELDEVTGTPVIHVGE